MKGKVASKKEERIPDKSRPQKNDTMWGIFVLNSKELWSPFKNVRSKLKKNQNISVDEQNQAIAISTALRSI